MNKGIYRVKKGALQYASHKVVALDHTISIDAAEVPDRQTNIKVDPQAKHDGELIHGDWRWFGSEQAARTWFGKAIKEEGPTI